MNDAELDALVARLRDMALANKLAGWNGDAKDDTDAADAIAALRQERDTARAENERLLKQIASIRETFHGSPTNDKHR